MGRCIHDMEEGTCSWCSGRMGIEAPQDDGRARRAYYAKKREKGPVWVVAQFGGKCANCEYPFEAGEEIAPARQEVIGWVAKCCQELA